jgi:hypothetical protein
MREAVSDPTGKKAQLIVDNHPLGAELEDMIQAYIIPNKVGKTRFLAKLLTEYNVTPK